MDDQILTAVKAGISGAKAKDVFRNAPYKVNLYEEQGQGSVNRAKIDLNRNGKWDEKWDWTPSGTVKREVAPNDDEQYTDKYVTHRNRLAKGVIGSVGARPHSGRPATAISAARQTDLREASRTR